MRKMIVPLDWRFGAMSAGSPTLPDVHTFVPTSKSISTGARWCGDHGLVMEVCKVIFAHAFDMREGDQKWDVWPSGVVWDKAMAAMAGTDQQFSVSYVTTLAVGSGHKLSAIDPVRDRLTLGEARYTTMVDGIATSTNIRSIQILESGLVWDLTDSAGNGTLVAAADLELEGSCKTKSTETNRDIWPKRLAPPFNRCDVQIGATSEYSYHPVTDCHIIYRMKRVTMQDWYALTHDQMNEQN